MLLDEFPHMITLQHVTYSQDADGGDVRNVLAPYASNVPAWVQPASSNDIREFAVRNQNVSHRIFVPADPGLQLDDVLTVIDGPSYAGYTLRIISWREATAGLAVAWKIFAEISRQMPST